MASSGAHIVALFVATGAVALGLASLFNPWFRQIDSELTVTNAYGEFEVSVDWYYDEACRTVQTTLANGTFGRVEQCASYGAIALSLSDDNGIVPDFAQEALDEIHTDAQTVVVAVGLGLASLGLLIGIAYREYPSGGGQKVFAVFMLLGGALMAASLPVLYYDIVKRVEDLNTEDSVDSESGLGMIFLIIASILSWAAAIGSLAAGCCTQQARTFNGARLPKEEAQMTSVSAGDDGHIVGGPGI